MENSETNQAAQPPHSQQPANDPFVLPATFKVSLTMLSDWHVGTGAGRPGSVDKLIARDADGFPFVPAKTLNGIWRDAMERLTLGLDGGKAGAWLKWVEKIFGIQPNQIDAADLDRRLQNNEATYNFSPLSIQPARLSENLRAKINQAVSHTSVTEKERKRQRQKLLAALTFIKPGVAIDEKSGTAVTDFLRFEEMGRAGTVLEAECRLAETDETISALLLLSAKLVERVGGKRRRGAGLCELKVVGCGQSQIDQAISHLRQRELAGKEVEPLAKNGINDDHESEQRSIIRETEVASGEAAAEAQPDKRETWQTLEFTLKLHTPVSIVTATLGNVSESLDYIPGTYLLPHITKVLRAKLGGKVFQAVAYGDLQVLPATVEINKARGLPVPRALARHKTDGSFEKRGTLYNKFAREKETDKQLKAYRRGYVQALDSVVEIKDNRGTLPSFKDVHMSLLMHNTVKDEIQRPHEDVGGVYSREAIPAGTSLRGEIRVRQKLARELAELDADWWKVFANKDNAILRLGTSRKDDYGLVELSLSAPKKFSSPSTLKVNRLTVYLLSDCLLRNSHLRQTNLVDELAKELSGEDKLNVKITPIRSSDQETTSLVMTRRIESWHEGWGFPRPTLIAMEAGSCAVFEIEDFAALNDEGKAALEERLREVEAAGIGERRGEGYGQVRFNPPLLTEEINGWEQASKPEETKPPAGGAASELGEEERAFAELIEETAWREELKVAVLKVADDAERRKKIFGFDIDSQHNKPPMSQIGGLRSVISRLQQPADRAIAIDWLEHLKVTPNRRDKWAKGKEAAETKLNKIINLLDPASRKQKAHDEPQNVWEWLDSAFTAPPTLVRGKEDLQKQFWAEAVRSLLDACARAHKRELEKKGVS